MKIFDTLSQDYKNLDKKKLNIYSCGPTIYDYIHIGNARPIILMDTLIRFFESQNIEVNFLQNITDIDDKIINKAALLNISEKEVSNKFLNAYLKDLQNLKIRMPNKLMPISEKIKEMDSFIIQLINKKHAYNVNGDVFFDINSLKKEYGKLSNKNIDDLIVGSRVEIDLKKSNPLDFSIWKKTDKGIKWDSSNGEGRPGWHTECALLIDTYFNGETIDIHSGGIDLQFPHHENERIQFIAKNNKELSDVWMHNGHLTIKNEKMSKSEENVIYLKDFLKEYNSNILRWIFFSTHYRNPMNINDELLEQSIKFSDKVSNLIKKTNKYLIENNLELNKQRILSEDIVKFNQYMNDDLNTARVLTLIEELIKSIQLNIKSNKQKELITNLLDLKYIFNVLGFDFNMDFDFSETIKNKYFDWKELIEIKKYEEADQIREWLIENGVI